MFDDCNILAQYKNNIHIHFKICKELASILLILPMFLIFLSMTTLTFVNG